MIDWVFILTPLAVLPIVLLFRFVGCGLNAVGELEEIPLPQRNPPRYRDYILADPFAPPGGVVQHYDVTPNRADVIGYWRLIDVKPGPAADEKGFQAGEYVEVAQQIQEPLSDAGPGPGLVDPSQLSLIESDPQVRCRTFLGGCMRVVNRLNSFRSASPSKRGCRPGGPLAGSSTRCSAQAIRDGRRPRASRSTPMGPTVGDTPGAVRRAHARSGPPRGEPHGQSSHCLDGRGARLWTACSSVHRR